jgi:hypothetical protein
VGLPEITVRLVVGHPPELTLNGEPLPDGFTFEQLRWGAGGLPQLVVAVEGEVTLEGEAVVQVVRDLDQRQVVVGWLKALDPEVIDRDSLKAWDDPEFTDDRPGAHIMWALRKAASA